MALAELKSVHLWEEHPIYILVQESVYSIYLIFLFRI